MNTHTVVIAGGGPTGLMLAAELKLAQIDVVIVERRTTQALETVRSGGLHARTIEVLDQRGVAERFVSEGQKMQIASVGAAPLDISDFPTRHNYGLALYQDRFELILAKWVLEDLAVPIVRGREVTDFTASETGVEVQLSDGTQLGAQYLVGCDGGRSLIRKKAGIDFVGWDASVSYILAEVRMRGEPAWGLRRSAQGSQAIAKLADGRARIVLADPVVKLGEQPDLEELRAALIAVYGSDFGLQEATWISRFSDAARQAVAYRKGRVLLAGDAAHVHSPVGGQGLNLGVQDAVNLGWKLAQVARGTSSPALLDTYQAERHPVGARVLKNSLAMTALGRGDDRSSALRDLLGDILKASDARKQMAAMLSGLDIKYELGAGHPLLGRRMPDLEVVTSSGPQRVFSFLHRAQPVLLNLGRVDAFEGLKSWADRVQKIDVQYAGAWELPVIGAVPAPSAVLVRPDGHVAWVGDGSDAGLAAALDTWFGS